MFQSDFSELILIFIVTILVLGPKRLPEAATKLGLFLYKLKQLWQNLTSSISEQTKTQDDNHNTPD